MTVDKVPGATDVLGHQRTEYLCQWFKGATASRGGYEEHMLEKYVPPAKR
jgi:uncharacterized protein YodC (DUF2158 family)